MGFIDEIKARAKACKKTIVLPETEDERTYKAAETVLKEGLADLVLVGSKEEIEKNKGTYDISGATIVDPATDARVIAVAHVLLKLLDIGIHTSSSYSSRTLSQRSMTSPGDGCDVEISESAPSFS
jgi:phosphotransacetylase